MGNLPQSGSPGITTAAYRQFLSVSPVGSSLGSRACWNLPLPLPRIGCRTGISAALHQSPAGGGAPCCEPTRAVMVHLAGSHPETDAGAAVIELPGLQDFLGFDLGSDPRWVGWCVCFSDCLFAGNRDRDDLGC